MNKILRSAQTMTSEKLIVITGATGQQGGAIANELLSKGYKVRAMTRKPDSEKAKELSANGTEVVYGDLDNPESLEKALEGCWGTFAVQNTWEAGVEKEEEQGKRFAEIAKQKNIQFYFYSSVGSAHRNTGIPHFENKWRIEEKIRALGFPSYTIIRPVFFMENLALPMFKPAIDEGKLAVGIKPDTKLQMIAVNDIGKYGLWVFENHENLNGRAIDIAGDEITMPQAAELISKAKEEKVTFSQVPIEEIRKFSEDYAIMLEWFDEVGYNAEINKNAKESGVKPTRFAEWVKTIKW
jgi:uncharacterized protein YbjT (DUF2867 family)